MVALAGRLVGRGQRRADHDGVGAAGDGLGDVAPGPHAAVGDDVDVDAGLVEVAHAGAGGVGDGGGLGDADAEHAPAGAGLAGADADEHGDGPRPHEVERRRVRGAAADDDRQLELPDELLQVERLGVLAHVLGGDDRALDDEDVELGVEHRLGVALGLLRRERGGGRDPDGLDLLDAGADQLVLDRLGVDLLHPQRGLLGRQLGDLFEERLGVLVPGPQPFEVEDGETADAGRSRWRWPGRPHRPWPPP